MQSEMDMQFAAQYLCQLNLLVSGQQETCCSPGLLNFAGWRTHGCNASVTVQEPALMQQG